ncbi:MAG: flagellar biosynthesis protein FlhB [Oscillospiraceae bacterium]|nr:flagellar biosynthesis protein FlhB [Oscillospiraceae bacterium]
MADSSKTEKATPKKRRDERKKGNVFLSKDAIAVLTLLGSFATLQLLAGTFVEQLSQFLEFCVGAVAAPLEGTGGVLVDLRTQAIWSVAKTVGPLVAVTIVCAVVGTFAQTRFLVSGESIKPKFNRISPLQGFKRLFSMRSVVETLKGILKISILLYIIYTCLVGMFGESAKYLYAEVPAASSHLFGTIMSMVWKIAVAFVALAAADFFYQWWDYERQLRMSKQEIKEEYKQLEGNPQVKGKIRDIQRQMARSRMMQQVPGADVVIRNPTHVAVALRYKPGQDAAPIVLAMGLDEVALRIVAKAEECGIAIVENVPLARGLYAAADLNQEIPPEFYNDVAEVLVYIFRLNDKKEIVK